MERLTKEQAAIIGAYTGYLVGPFSDKREYVERILKRCVSTHEMGNDKVAAEIKEKSRADFLAIVAQ